MNNSNRVLNRVKPTATLADIKRITSSGIVYTDANGEMSFVDFAVCAENWLTHNADNSSNTLEWRQRCVGEHNVCAIPPYIEFFTQPRTRFEFSFETPCETRDERFYWLSEWLNKAGWVTFDRS